MANIWYIFKREISGYFITPVAYVFIVIFLFLTGIFTFYVGGFYERGQADLLPFFSFLPWLYLFLIPAITMRLWSEERKTGTIELLLTLPIEMNHAVIGKFLAAWAFTAITLVLTMPLWITVNYLGNPDNGVILAGYIGSVLMAGAYLAVGSFMSSLTKNQVIAFVSTVVVLLLFVLAGFEVVTQVVEPWTAQVIVDAVSSMSLLTNFQDIQRGVIDIRHVVYFLSMMACFLFANAIMVELKKAE